MGSRKDQYCDEMTDWMRSKQHAHQTFNQEQSGDTASANLDGSICLSEHKKKRSHR